MQYFIYPIIENDKTYTKKVNYYENRYIIKSFRINDYLIIL